MHASARIVHMRMYAPADSLKVPLDPLHHQLLLLLLEVHVYRVHVVAIDLDLRQNAVGLS